MFFLFQTERSDLQKIPPPELKRCTTAALLNVNSGQRMCREPRHDSLNQLARAARVHKQPMGTI